jgi:hypothetical protein
MGIRSKNGGYMLNFIRSFTLILVTVAIYDSITVVAMAETEVTTDHINRKVEHRVQAIERSAEAIEKSAKEFEREIDQKTERFQRAADRKAENLEREIQRSALRMKKDILKNLKKNHNIQIDIEEDKDFIIKKEFRDEEDEDYDDKKVHKDIKVVMNNAGDGPPVEIIVPIAFFMTFPFCLFLLFFFKHRTNREKQITLRTMVENGTNIPAEMFMEGKSRLTPIEKDRKNGIVYTLSSIGIILFLLVLNAGPKGLWSIGFIPLLMGIGNLINWKMASNESSKEVEVEVEVTTEKAD